jgi:hypothetical protein
MEIKLGEQIIINLYQTVLYCFDVSLHCSRDGKLDGDWGSGVTKLGALFLFQFDFQNMLSFQEKIRQLDKTYSQHISPNKNAPIKKNYPMEIYNFPPLTSSTFRVFSLANNEN